MEEALSASRRLGLRGSVSDHVPGPDHGRVRWSWPGFVSGSRACEGGVGWVKDCVIVAACVGG